MSWGYRWKPYVSAAEKRANAKAYSAALAKKGRVLHPIQINGLKIATTFWGAAWCDNLESYSDFSNRLPRGRTYVRNGSVIDVQISPGAINALVSGSEMYAIQIDIDRVKPADWKKMASDCSKQVMSLMDLLQGKLSAEVMRRITQRPGGLFPNPKEIKMKCSCPDWAYMCKHIAAVLYGVGARLDEEPELLFLLRKVDHLDLVNQAVETDLDQTIAKSGSNALDGEDLGAMFGIEIDTTVAAAPAAPAVAARTVAALPGGARKSKGSPRTKSATVAASVSTMNEASPTTPKSESKAKSASTPKTRVASRRKLSAAVTARKRASASSKAPAVQDDKPESAVIAYLRKQLAQKANSTRKGKTKA